MFFGPLAVLAVVAVVGNAAGLALWIGKNVEQARDEAARQRRESR